MPHGKRAVGGGIGCQIRAQPLFLGRSGIAATDIAAVAVERNDMPVSQIETVITL